MAKIVDAFEDQQVEAARTLIREYFTETAAELGVTADSLPHQIDDELRDLSAFYAAPGTVLLAVADRRFVGCVGLRALSHQTAEVRRLYLRSYERGAGRGLELMDALHAHARSAGIRSLVLDVLPSRVQVIEWYRRLGYSDIPPYGESEQSMVFLGRSL